jgi:GNAT superfamily N-acetyltransferase
VRSLAAQAEYIEGAACAQMQLALSPGLRAALEIEVIWDGDAVSLLAPRADIASFNRAIGFGLARDLSDEQLRAINAPYVRAGIRRWLIELSPEARPPTASELLGRHGGRAVTPTVKFWRRLDRDLPTVASTGLRIAEVGLADADVFQSVVATSMGFPETAAPSVRSTLGHDGWHLYLAVDQGVPIAGALLFTHGEGAWLGMGATLPEARGRGAQTALITHRLREAARVGCQWATAETTPDTAERPNPSYRNMLRGGMQVLYHRAKYLFELDSLPADTRPSA